MLLCFLCSAKVDGTRMGGSWQIQFKIVGAEDGGFAGPMQNAKSASNRNLGNHGFTTAQIVSRYLIYVSAYPDVNTES